MKLKREIFLIIIWFELVLSEKYVNHNKCSKNTPNVYIIHLKKKQIQDIRVSSDTLLSYSHGLLVYVQPQSV